MRNSTIQTILPATILLSSLTVLSGCSSRSRETDIELPGGVHLVMVDIPGRNIKIGKYEVTQAQWGVLMRHNPSDHIAGNLPVDDVSFSDCQRFIDDLNELDVVKKTGLKFRLPSLDEWTYACLAGAEKKYCKLAGGTEITANTIEQVAWFCDNSNEETHPVGQKKPNAFGLYDMLGNVSEWTMDEVFCGGNGRDQAGRCKVTNSSDTPLFSSDESFVGFRLCASKQAN